MAGYTTPYPPDWKEQRRLLRERARIARQQARMQRQTMRAQSHLYRQRLRSMRGGSILGPLVLIAIGVVFLMIETGHLQALRFWTWYGRWWPILLVGAGVLVLAEWIVDRALASDDRPMVRRGLGFGVVFIFFLVVCTGLIAAHGSRFWPLSPDFAFGDHDQAFAEFLGNLHEMDQPFDESLPAGATLSIDSPRGGVNISGTSSDGQMHIQLRREIYTNSDSDAQQKAAQLVPQLQTSGKQVTLSLPPVVGTETGMTITVPPATPLSIHTSHGDIDVSAIQGPVTLSSTQGSIAISSVTGQVDARIDNNGSFTARGITGSVTLETRGHDITITDVTGSAMVRSQAGGSTHFERIQGAAGYHSDRTQFDAVRLDGQFDTNGKYLTVQQAVGPVTLTTYSYDITLDRIAGPASIRNSNGSVDLIAAPPLGDISIDNHNNPVTLTLPEHSGFTVEANATNGQIFSDFSLQPQTQRNDASLTGAVGSGGPIVRVTTNHGDIALRKADVQPLPATPPALHPASANAPLPRSAGLADARDQVRQALMESKQAIQQSREEARQAAREAQQQTAEARREAQQQAAEVRREAQQAARDSSN